MPLALKKQVLLLERRRLPRTLINLPLEYRWVNCTRYRGAYTGDASRLGLLMYSVDDMPIGAELEVWLFFADDYRLDTVGFLAKIVRKDLHRDRDWKGYKYGIEFTEISGQDREKLELILRQDSH